MTRGKVRVSAIGNPGITGTITRFDVPDEIPVGDEIEIHVDGNLLDYSRIGAWSGVIAARGNGQKDHDICGGAGTEIGWGDPWPNPLQPWVNLKLGIMPDHDVDIEVRLYGNKKFWTSFDWDVWPE